MEIPSGTPSKLSLFKYVGVPALVAAVGFVSFNGVFFYNEAGFATHVRTIFGEEKIVDDVGYATKWFGRATPWKKALSVQSVLTEALEIDDSSDNDSLGATIEAFPIVFLGNVDAKVESSARFRLPSGEQFLKIAQEYRNPENFIKTALVPAIKETLQATASLMSADDFYAGARSEFAAEFENQLNDGLYLIKRKEIRGPRGHLPSQTAILQAGTEQGNFGDNNASQFVTEKVMDSKGIPVRKQQQFRKYGVEVVEARITNVDPNPQYKQRMVKVQQALAELAVARQNRLKEEEEKLLVTARGEKEVEARRQETLRDQIEQTTQAETEKQLAVINAEREKQRAEIEKQTAELLRDKASITAQATKITADAEAYARKAVIEADGALQPKLDALVQINKVWAEAASQAPVPGVMMGGSGNGASASRQDEIGQLMGILATKAARDLSLDMKVKE
ncbi:MULTISPECIES: SPFH domain-containing protein [Pseudomonadaceae]|jgi:regulator of protease activity HflC (stomatin/prohibitin superfamily)|uniref:SPFH domain-containing protein n=1 Tax=Aquipseudomonas alcaligenes TaxID=43263 RepID=A0AA42SQV4_AQUAC|nr:MULTISPECIES: SPFH domain-containing protein [Pseudomonas]AMR66702.1 membrane protease subunit, stomatin/prohibitin [Pseudomonas alcaligenes]MDH0141708.1 SPFH domain-containing protein [Pseudomonas alcaligenes]MDH1053219.1 SPFH domain-containing protein [Pseudomonas alcaligenes]MEE1951492.1 SPFH domain-containing protein [Pseudomonas alcaligenes]NMY41470.1 membrane protease subunit, stomatin/prohibitin [Pseudomonas sp. WS 5013]